MSLEVIRRPEIVEYSTGFEARWKCAWLPILWKFQSDLFPTNSVDAALTITSVADNGDGLAEFTTAENQLLSRFDWVNVTSSTITDYEGINQLVEVPAANRFTLNIPFSATATGSAIKYYNNYHALIEVYGGLPSGHEFENQDPSLLTTTVKIFFDANNIAVVDLSRIAQTLINNIFDRDIPSWPNVLNFWNQTEILLKESFDQSTGVVVTTLERYGCIKDGGFVTGADWSNEGTGATWTFGSDQANVSLDEAGDADSKELTQTILGDALARFSITATVTFTHTSGTPTLRLKAVIGGTVISVQGSTTAQGTFTKTVTGLTANATGIFSLEAIITAGSGTDTADIVLDDVEVCIGVANKVVNSKLAFRNGRGGNLIDHIARSIASPSKWLTNFTEGMTIFGGKYLSLSFLRDDWLALAPRLFIRSKDVAGNKIGTDLVLAIEDQDIGLYQLRIENLNFDAAAKCIDVAIIDVSAGIAGAVWEEITTGTAIALHAVVVESLDIIWIGGPRNSTSGDTLLRSTDIGVSFSEITLPWSEASGLSELTIDRTGITVVFILGNPVAVTTDDYAFSTDGGQIWQNINIVGNGTVLGNPQRLYSVNVGLHFAMNEAGAVFKSSDTGATWVALANFPSAGGFHGDISFFNTLVGWVCGKNGDVFKTTDSGATAWVTQVTPIATVLNGLFFFDGTDGICVGDAGEIIKTTNGGTTWTSKTSGTVQDLYAVYFIDANNGWICGDNGVILSSTDGGETWSVDITPAGVATDDFRNIHAFEAEGQILVIAVGLSGKAIKLSSVANFDLAITETQEICIEQDCCDHPIYLTWLNNLGGWDFWEFCAEKDFNIDISESQRTVKNIYDDWPLSYDKETLGEEALIKAKKSTLVRSQFLTQQQVEAIAGIKTSMHVLQLIDGIDDKVTVLVDKNSFRIFTESDKIHTIQFIIQTTDDIPTQSN